MRVRIPMRRAVLFTAMFGFALILFLPLRLALGAAADVLRAREASGSVWAGRLKEARIGPAALGDLDARLDPLALLVGEARIVVARPSAAPDRLAGAFGIARNRSSAESVTGVIPVESLFAPLPIGSLELTDVTVRFRDGACDRAEGLVRADISGEIAGLALPAGLSGAPRCDRGALLLPLTGGAGEGLALRIFGDGRYEARLSVRAADPDVVARLTGAGFAPGPGGYALTLGGRF
jgi:general secretion pathway protein N